jgi:hypothetical protein
MAPSVVSHLTHREQTFAQPERAPPPTQLELETARDAEFVICD